MTSSSAIRCKSTGKLFSLSPDQIEFYRKLEVPFPALCPEERLRRRLAYHNRIYVYRRNSSATGQPIFSMYAPDAPFPVIEKETWWGDSWDGCDFGRSYEFNTAFFNQFRALRREVPTFPLSTVRVENSEYINNSTSVRNSYLVSGLEVEDSMYCAVLEYSKDCMDCTWVSRSEMCFNCVMCNDCFNLQDSVDCSGCSNSYFLLNCRACQDCFGCANLAHKKYHIYNEPYSENAYRQFLSALDLSSYKERSQIAAGLSKFFLQFPRPAVAMLQVEDASGNHIYESRAVHNSYFVRSCENLINCFDLRGAHDCMDFTIWGNGAELVYESAVCGNNVYNIKFCYQCFDNLSNLEYCQFCINCSNCFGCAGLRNKEFCILNQQYSESEYFELLPRIKAHMASTGEYGEFFPMTDSPIPYNHSHAQLYFPISQQEARMDGLYWFEREHESAPSVLTSNALPDGLPAGDESLVVESIESGKPFRITSAEVQRYRQLRVPLPRYSYDERMNHRAVLMGGLTLYDRRCARSGRGISTPYPPESSVIVWDREVFEGEIWG